MNTHSTGAGFCKHSAPIADSVSAPSGEVNATWPIVQGGTFACGDYTAGTYSTWVSS